MDPVLELKRRVARYLKKTGQSKTAFGLAVKNNPALVPRIERGEIGLKTIRIVSEYLDRQEAA